MGKSRAEYMRDYRQKKRQEKLKTENVEEKLKPGKAVPKKNARNSTQRSRDFRARAANSILKQTSTADPNTASPSLVVNHATLQLASLQFSPLTSTATACNTSSAKIHSCPTDVEQERVVREDVEKAEHVNNSTVQMGKSRAEYMRDYRQKKRQEKLKTRKVEQKLEIGKVKLKKIARNSTQRSRDFRARAANSVLKQTSTGDLTTASPSLVASHAALQLPFFSTPPTSIIKLSNDMDNYMEYHVMGSMSQVLMKPGCIPTKFEWQTDTRKKTSVTTELPYILKKQRKMLIEKIEKEYEENNIITKHLEPGETSSGSSEKKIVREKWVKQARRDPVGVVTNSPLYFCEDQFDLSNDMEKDMQYVSKVHMNPGGIPKKIACQPDIKTRKSDIVQRSYLGKKQKMLLKECEKQESSVVKENFNSIQKFSKEQLVCTAAAEKLESHGISETEVKKEIVDDEEYAQSDLTNQPELEKSIEYVNYYDCEFETIKHEPLEEESTQLNSGLGNNSLTELPNEDTNEVLVINLNDKKYQDIIKTESLEDAKVLDTAEDSSIPHNVLVNDDVECKMLDNNLNFLKHNIKYMKLDGISSDIKLDKFLQVNRKQLKSMDNKRSKQKITKLYPCQYCKKVFKNNKAKSTHLKNVHIGNKCHCDLCGKTFKCLSLLRRHIKFAHSNEEHKCQICEAIFKNKGYLDRHIKCTHSREEHKCEYCQRVFKNKKYLKSHESIVHSNIEYKCDTCEAVYKSNYFFMLHQSIHKSILKYKL